MPDSPKGENEEILENKDFFLMKEEAGTLLNVIS